MYARILCGDGGPSIAGSIVNEGDIRADKSVIDDAAVDAAGLLFGLMPSARWYEPICRDILIDFLPCRRRDTLPGDRVG